MDAESPAGLYRHYKGNLYRVIGEARHSETKEALIVYVSATDEAEMWVRPKAMFFETVPVEGIERPRFERVGP